MQLNKVKEFIFNERSSLASNNASAKFKTSDGTSLQREFDLVVKIERIWSITYQKAKQEMTGGVLPEVRMKQVGEKQVEQIEPAFMIRVSDSSYMTFELCVMKSLMPEGLKKDDVVRVKSVVAT